MDYDFKSIKVKGDQYKELLRLKDYYRKLTGRKISLAYVMNKLLKKK